MSQRVFGAHLQVPVGLSCIWSGCPVYLQLSNQRTPVLYGESPDFQHGALARAERESCQAPDYTGGAQKPSSGAHRLSQLSSPVRNRFRRAGTDRQCCSVVLLSRRSSRCARHQRHGISTYRARLDLSSFSGMIRHLIGTSSRRERQQQGRSIPSFPYGALRWNAAGAQYSQGDTAGGGGRLGGRVGSTLQRPG